MRRESDISRPEYISTAKEGAWRIVVWVQPGASNSDIVGLYQGCVKIKLNAPAVDNKANKALVTFVAKKLKLKKSQVVLESGFTTRRKRLAVNTADEPNWAALNPVK